MFKKILIAAALLLSVTTHAGEDPKALMSLPDNPAVVAQAGSVCYAYTACPNGGAVWCKVWSGPGGQCIWQTVPGVGVHCEGHDAYGNWQTYTFYCP